MIIRLAIVLVLAVSLHAQQPIGPVAQNGPLIGPLCVDVKGKVYSCYLVDAPPGKPPTIINGAYMPAQRAATPKSGRWTFADAKRRARRDIGAVGRAIVVVVAAPLP